MCLYKSKVRALYVNRVWSLHARVSHLDKVFICHNTVTSCNRYNASYSKGNHWLRPLTVLQWSGTEQMLPWSHIQYSTCMISKPGWGYSKTGSCSSMFIRPISSGSAPWLTKYTTSWSRLVPAKTEERGEGQGTKKVDAACTLEGNLGGYARAKYPWFFMREREDWNQLLSEKSMSTCIHLQCIFFQNASDTDICSLRQLTHTQGCEEKKAGFNH